METLKQTADATREQQTSIGELQQQSRAAFAITIGSIKSIDQNERQAEVFLDDENKTVKAIVAIHPDYTSMFSALTAGDFVLVMHKAGIGALIILKVANDRNTTYKSTEPSRLQNLLNTAFGG